MGFFRKKSSDVGVVDLADFQRRGIFKPKSLPKKTMIATDSQGYADLGKASEIQPQTSQSSGGGGGGGFFDWFGGSSSNSTTNSPPATASNSEYGSSTTNTDLSMLKNKIEDVEFKIENIGRKLNNFLERLELAEKKINRLEGR